MRDRIASILKRIDFGGQITPREVGQLRGIPFEEWPPHALGAWWWTGATRPERSVGDQYQRVKAQVTVNGKVITPARVLYEFFTGREAPKNDAFRHRLSGRDWRGIARDDVNPAHYVIGHVGTRYVPKKPRGPNPPKADMSLLFLLYENDFFPNSVEELIARFPDAAQIPREILEATLHETK